MTRPPGPAMPVVAVTGGRVAGCHAEGGVLAFLGLPFAAAPIGPLRFAPPAPIRPWTGVRDASHLGPTAPQSVGTSPVSALLPHVSIAGEDYLNLNVWTSDLDGSRPVLVFVHGGSFTSGSNAITTYDGARFARDGVVLVTINYRLGADGYLWFGDGTPNRGLLDQVAALRWVAENVARFGGDARNVTVFGESAGGMSVCTLLATPGAEGLFRRAIAQSGAAQCVISPEAAAITGRRLAELLDVRPTLEAMGDVPRARLLAAQEQLAMEVAGDPRRERWGDVGTNLMPFEPVVDGTVLPTLPIDAVRAGASADVDLLVGTNSDEAHLFFAPTGVLVGADTEALDHYVDVRDYPRSMIERYRTRTPTPSPGELISIFMTDGFYRLPTLELAEAHGRAYVYEFAWTSPACGGRMGACHALELPFVFDRLDDPGYAELLGTDPPQSVADAMHRAWIAFAEDGGPGWAPYSVDGGTSMRFDVTSAVTVSDRAAELAGWSSSRQ